MMIILVRTVSLSLALFISVNSFAWGPMGHRVVAEIAQKHLSPAASAACAHFLTGYTLAMVANVPDELRGIPEDKPLEPLHFINIPDGGKKYEDAPKNPAGDLVVAIYVLSEYLKTGNEEVLKTVPAFTKVKIDREIALEFLVHFIADIHQPLHVGYASDYGGNKVRVNWMHNEHSNLHEVWDEKLVNHETLSYTEFAEYLSVVMEHLTPEQRKALETLDFKAWANESIALLKDVYQFPDDPMSSPKTASEGPTEHVVSWNYINKNRPIVRRRLLEAGVRLAYVLNTIFQEK